MQLITECNSSGCLSIQGAFVVDRLSILHISAVQRLTGAVTLSTLSMDIPESSFGEVEKIEHVVFNEKRLALLRLYQQKAIFTMALFYYNYTNSCCFSLSHLSLVISTWLNNSPSWHGNITRKIFWKFY